MTLKRILSQTQDGSPTLFIPEWNEGYHSHHGALQEAQHVFIANGLHLKKENQSLCILEMGLGTGLNFLLTMLDALQSGQHIHYYGVEKYPIHKEELEALAYHTLLDDTVMYQFFRDCMLDDTKTVRTYQNIQFSYLNIDFSELKDNTLPSMDIVYYDAFGFRAQPQVWDAEIFKQLDDLMDSGSLITTYSCKGEVRRTWQNLGWTVEKKPGPPGKREMMIAWKK